MFIRVWYPYIVVSFIVIPCIIAKPFSLNEAIAAEERQKQSLQTTSRSKLASENPEKILLNKSPRYLHTKLKKAKGRDEILPRTKKIFSSLKYRKKFQIKSPLKPKKIRHIQKSWSKRKNQYRKRQTNEDEKILRKYVPLLKSLRLLFDNVLDGDINGSDERRRQKYRKYRNTSKGNNTTCRCTGQPDNSQSTKEAITFTTPVDEITTLSEPITTETPTTTTDYTTTSDIGGLRQDPDLPVLFTGDTTSTRGNNTGFGERSSSSFHTSVEGHITRNYGNSQRYTGSRKDKPGTENYEENTDSDSRNSASSYELGRGLRGNRGHEPSPVYRGGSDGAHVHAQSEETSRNDRGNFNEFEGKNKFEIGRNEIEGSEFLQQFVRHGGSVPNDYVNNDAESIQSKKGDKESNHSVAFDIADDKRFVVGNGAPATEDQKTSPTIETVISNTNSNNPLIMLQNSPKYKAPFVTIIDGYSVARDKNGANKIAEQSIRFHT